MEHGILIPNLFKTEYRKIVSVLCKLFGLKHIQIAEDIANDTFLLASETWGQKGIPENPKAWLYAVAKNKTKDYLRRAQNFQEKIAPQIQRSESSSIDLDLSEANIQDSQLQMMFAICTDIISAQAQIGLALRILCGFGIQEIANAFVTQKETINKRLLRAKQKLRKENFDIAFPSENEMEHRLDNVLTTIYLLFNEGCYSSVDVPIKKELCLEAMRLVYLLTQHQKTNLPKTNALLSLLCFHSSRLEARKTKTGAYLLYEEQNQDHWDKALIRRGEYYLHESAQGSSLSKYHLEARIAYWHTREEESPEKWENILHLYNLLLQMHYSPVIALNRTYALSKTNGKKLAIKEALKINLKNNHYYHALMAELYDGINQQKHMYHLKLAIGLVVNETDKRRLVKKIKKASR